MIRRSTWIILGIFILLVAVVLIWQRVQENRQAQITPTPATSYLFDLEGKTITGISITGLANQSVAATKDTDGSWNLVEPAGQLADSSRIDAAVGSASGLRVLTSLNQAEDLETLGLNPASYHIELTLDDGTRMNVFVGTLTPTQSGYNAFVEGQPLKIIERYALDQVLDIMNNPPILLPTPTDTFLPTIQP
jgi:hypothetical protein